MQNNVHSPARNVSLENDSGRLGADVIKVVGKSPFHVMPRDESNFSTHRFGEIRHTFNLHPLMQMPQLLELAKELFPLGGCRFIEPGTTESSAFVHRPRSRKGIGIEEVFQRIEEPGSWVALYNVENIPRYREFLLEVLGTVRPLVQREHAEMLMTTGFIFISSPPSVTPFHIDRENNFWLQIRGRKHISLWDRDDRSIVSAEDVEAFIVHRNLENVRLTDASRDRARTFDTGPGDGMYFPSTTPHMTRTTTDWVLPGDGVSISIGVNFYTDLTRRHALVHQFNRALRHLGIVPRAPGQSAWRDRLKAPFGRAAIQWRKLRTPDYKVPPGGQ